MKTVFFNNFLRKAKPEHSSSPLSYQALNEPVGPSSGGKSNTQFNLITGKNETGILAYLHHIHSQRPIPPQKVRPNSHRYRTPYGSMTIRHLGESLYTHPVMEVIQAIDPSITSLDLATDPPSFIQNGEMRSLYNNIYAGNNIRQVISIFATLACAPTGHLIIENMEHYLHYTILEPLWKLIIKQAICQETTIYASTQSLDCIKAFTLAIASEGQQHNSQLVRFDNEIRHTIYTH